MWPRTRPGQYCLAWTWKVLRFGQTRTTASIDLYNALNANPVLTQSNAFATWLRPQSILLARFLKVGVQFDF